MNKRINIVLYFLLFISLVGCDDGNNVYGENPSYLGFVTPEIVLDVTPETKSFRIEVEWTHRIGSHPPIRIDRDNTTAKHNVHFVNTPEGDSYIGRFTPSSEENRIYKDVQIIPENITEKVVIVYYASSGWIEDEPKGLIKELKVVLQPKASN